MAGKDLKAFEDKVRKGFRFFDVDKDGMLTRQELLGYGEMLSTLSHADEKQAQKTKTIWEGWANTVLPEGRVNVSQFFERNLELLTNRRDSFTEANRTTHKDAFQKIDVDKDGFISMEELSLYYKAVGCNDKNFVRNVFSTLDTNRDGLISQDEFVDAFTAYWSDDPGFTILYDPTDPTMQ